MINVLVVDDSAIVRKLLTDELSRFSDIRVVGTAVDPYAAREKIAQLAPDVLVLDVEMPRMDGLTFLEKLMAHHPLPVIILSSITPKGSDAALHALELGALEVISKPGSAYTVPDVKQRLVQAIRAAALAKVGRARAPAVPIQSCQKPQRQITRLDASSKVIVVGASTGGTKAIELLLRALPHDCPGILIVQHMPEAFTTAFAERLNRISPMDVREARDGEAVRRGLALIAPGNHHMIVRASGATYSVLLRDGPPVHHQRPAVDVLFTSAATALGRNAVGVLLTGMGADGASGMLGLREAGARTIAEAESSCVVFGMPKEAIALGAAEFILPLPEIAPAVLELAENRAAAATS